MGIMMAYGSYLGEEVDLLRTARTVVIMDTVFALCAGLAIFPIVFANGLDPAAGPGLVFVTLPLAFGNMSGGLVLGALFFLMLTFAALTSSISLLEPATAYMVERGRSRRSAALMMAGLCWALGLVTVFSFNIWSHVRMLDRDLMGLIELVANDIMLPLGGLLIALFAGWVLKDSILREQLAGMPAWGFTVWRWLLRVLCPLLVLAVLLNALL
jgi:NSS family neurotransmitter:Na+ symporter